MPSSKTFSPRDARTQLRHILAHDGPRGALIFLNGLTDFRFSALYRFDRDTLHNLCFYDRENPEVQTSSDIPVFASYCVFVRQLEQSFTTANSCDDPRVGDHPQRRRVRAYCGVPLIDRNGYIFGSVCHFNIEAMATPDRDVELLEEFGRVLNELDVLTTP